LFSTHTVEYRSFVPGRNRKDVFLGECFSILFPYKALTAHWVAVETLWLARAQVYATTMQCEEAFSLVWTFPLQPGRHARERKTPASKKSPNEIHHFNKVELLLQLSAWLEGEREETLQEYLDDNDDETSEWLFFVERVMQYLRPPHIIELLFSVWHPLIFTFYDSLKYIRKSQTLQIGVSIEILGFR
jgi:hypothetical protein